MQALKDSGIGWIGKVPASWSITRLKNFCSFQTGTTPPLNEGVNTDNDGSMWYTPKDLLDNSISPIVSEKYISHDAVKKYKLNTFPKNSILFVGIGSSLGKISCTMHESYSNQQITAIKLKKNLPQYISYFLLAATDFIKKDALYTTVPIVNNAYLGTVQTLIPPIPVQHSIIGYLYKKCNEIDSIVADIEKQIETLKQYKNSVITETVTKGLDPDVEMKDSGAKWLGTIPKAWNTDKLKYHLRRYEPRNPGNKIVLSLYRDFGVIPKGSRNDNYNVTSEDTSNYKYVLPGNFVINKMKAWQGSVAVSDYEGIVSPAYFIYVFKDDVFFKRYFHYLLRGCYKDEFMRLSGGIRVGQWDLPSSELDNIIVLIPPISEQKCIADYLDNKCAEIDKIIEGKQKQLDTLANYKKSLIYEYVTGKKEVPVQ